GGPGDDRRDSPTTAEGGPAHGSPAQTRQRAPHQTRAPSAHQTARVLSPVRYAASSRYEPLCSGTTAQFTLAMLSPIASFRRLIGRQSPTGTRVTIRAS